MLKPDILLFFSKIALLGQAWSVPEVLRPLYESSKILAQKMTIAVRTTTFNFFLFWFSS